MPTSRSYSEQISHNNENEKMNETFRLPFFHLHLCSKRVTRFSSDFGSDFSSDFVSDFGSDIGSDYGSDFCSNFGSDTDFGFPF